MHWKTDKIVEDLKKLPGISEVEAYGQGGDYDCDNLIVMVEGCKDRLYITGYPDNATRWEPCQSPSDTEVKYIEIKDGLDSDGGLTSEEEKLGEVYLRLRKYFKNLGGSIIRHYQQVY